MIEKYNIEMENYIGKTVIAKVLGAARDDKGKRIPGKLTEVRGICNFIGPNKITDVRLQITINRTPYEIMKVEDVCIQK